MPLIYPTLDLLLYDLRESLGTNESDIITKRDNFKRKLPAELNSQIDKLDTTAEYTHLLENKYLPFSDDSGLNYEGYYYPVKLSDSYGLLIDCSLKENLTNDNIADISTLKNTIKQKLADEKATLGQTWMFYASVQTNELEESDEIARHCYKYLMPESEWIKDKIAETHFSGGKVFELEGKQHVVIILFASDWNMTNTIPDFLHHALRLFWYRHKITWAYQQSRELKQLLKLETLKIQECRKQFQQQTDSPALLRKVNDILSSYISLLTGLESQKHTIEANLYNYQQRLATISENIPTFNLPSNFEQRTKEKYLRQIQTDYVSFSHQLKILENIVASIQAQEVTESVKHIAQAQNKVEWLQVLFISFYAAELARVIVELLQKKTDVDSSVDTIFSIIIMAVFSSIAAIISLGLIKHLKFSKHLLYAISIVFIGMLFVYSILVT